ncbi:serpin (serine proteinase inhibitor) superfamily protein [Acanthamoeba castellanii str. Neff]|uniref:Serpin (Serine proteinase inhibitor) superfamily protein n=1 Tax=Acanthamoeba castellanii (strain ATCC 30010 / Neff) TaxID=1257118 RepID=L8H9T5_ACACF|nr:serpin (serine proteinase inhibitor) superfamily protein [Acanthamoeba castellanii str. Neff]ELR22284.1 serpin (serine proteinase inhibitor) superfamily protein [Acanthamoeba castellanii str. Neff]
MEATTSAAGCMLATKLASKLDDDKNALISPLGVQLALALILAGSAAGENANQLLSAMGFSSELGREQVLSAMKTLVADIKHSEKAALVLENKMWVDTTLPLDPAFTARLGGLASDACAVNFAEIDREQVALSAFLTKINRPRDPPRAFTDTNGLAVINGAWFKGVWENAFPRENTRASPFHRLGGVDDDISSDVQMMRHESMSIAHGTFEHHTMVSLPHENSLLRLLVLLPHVNSSEALAAVRASLIGLPEQYKALVSGRRQWVELQLPKFQVSVEQELSPVLKSIGVVEPFAQESADFTGIIAQDASADPERSLLHMGKVIHKAILTVDEAGINNDVNDASGDSKPQFSLPPALRFVADRPFVFVLFHAQFHCPIFVGQVVQPM